MWFRGAPSQPTAAPREARVRRFRLDPRGQGLVEFAISFPVVMLMILFGVDFGRVFLGWVTLTNVVREAANYAAINPDAWPGSGGNAQAEYARLITTEAAQINCTLPGTPPDPTFPSGKDLGSPAIVSITCQFTLITPLIGNIVGNPLPVSASASFPIRSGSINGTPLGATLPTVGPVVPTPSQVPPPSTDPTVPPPPTPSPAPTPVPTCRVPTLIGVNTSQATSRWTSAGFNASNLTFNPLVPPNYKINQQSQTPGETILCTASMSVAP